MIEKLTYAFEEIGDDLPRPPLSALRALFAAGVIVSPRGWQALGLEARQTLTREGGRERIDLMVVREMLRAVPAANVKLFARSFDPDPAHVPDALRAALGASRPITDDEWRSLRAIDRHVLNTLAGNTRLLWRALDELTLGKALSGRNTARWSGALARCELRADPGALHRAMSGDLLGGRAFVLAKGSGRRAARRASETFDALADVEVGPTELDFALGPAVGVVVWQAHVSSWEGAFLPAASLQAAVTAAVALLGMVQELDPSASIGAAAIVEEPWAAGGDEPATVLYTRDKMNENLRALGRGPIGAPRPPSSSAPDAPDAPGAANGPAAGVVVPPGRPTPRVSVPSPTASSRVFVPPPSQSSRPGFGSLSTTPAPTPAATARPSAGGSQPPPSLAAPRSLQPTLPAHQPQRASEPPPPAAHPAPAASQGPWLAVSVASLLALLASLVVLAWTVFSGKR
jgi:hypothetical protein